MSNNTNTPTHRRHNPYHDYSQPCIYHITLVCSDRAQVLGRIVGETLEQARCELTPLGVAVSKCIRYIEVHGGKHGHNLQVIAKAVMPDHVHFILYVRERLSDCKLGDVIRGFKQGCNKALREAIDAQVAAAETARRTHGMGADRNGELDREQQSVPSSSGAPGVSPMHGGELPPEVLGVSPMHGGELPPEVLGVSPMHGGELPPVVHGSSSLSEGVSHPDLSHGYRQPPLPISSPRMLCDHALFDADFDETILRRKGQLQTMIRYVHNNPKHRWQKQQHPDRLIPIRGIKIAGRVYDAIGNITLLGMARHQVWVRSRWDETTRRNYQNNCIHKARQFHTLVSPFISPHEAAVRDVALKEGHSVIVIVDNGFSDYTQCPGGLYDYCVKGQVLVIVPCELPHISNKKTITRQECVMLNERAAEIANEQG